MVPRTTDTLYTDTVQITHRQLTYLLTPITSRQTLLTFLIYLPLNSTSFISLLSYFSSGVRPKKLRNEISRTITENSCLSKNFKSDIWTPVSKIRFTLSTLVSDLLNVFNLLLLYYRCRRKDN